MFGVHITSIVWSLPDCAFMQRLLRQKSSMDKPHIYAEETLPFRAIAANDGAGNCLAIGPSSAGMRD